MRLAINCKHSNVCNALIEVLLPLEWYAMSGEEVVLSEEAGGGSPGPRPVPGALAATTRGLASQRNNRIHRERAGLT